MSFLSTFDPHMTAPCNAHRHKLGATRLLEISTPPDKVPILSAMPHY